MPKFYIVTLVEGESESETHAVMGQIRRLTHEIADPESPVRVADLVVGTEIFPNHSAWRGWFKDVDSRFTDIMNYTKLTAKRLARERQEREARKK